MVLIDDWTGTAPASGDWTVVLRGEEVEADGSYHGWLSDDSAVGAETPYLAGERGQPAAGGQAGGCVQRDHGGELREARHRCEQSLQDELAGRERARRRTDDTAVNGEISDFSSPGGTRDGRVKPELAAPGERVLGAVSREAYPPG